MNDRPKVGEPFNPWREACGFYIPDVFGRVTNKSHGMKRLYERLVRYAGKNGLCFPSQETLAQDLGVSERQIRKDLKGLINFGLVRLQNRGRFKSSNRYEFLWHAIFDTVERQPTAAPGDAELPPDQDLNGSRRPPKKHTPDSVVRSRKSADSSESMRNQGSSYTPSTTGTTVPHKDRPHEEPQFLCMRNQGSSATGTTVPPNSVMNSVHRNSSSSSFRSGDAAANKNPEEDLSKTTTTEHCKLRVWMAEYLRSTRGDPRFGEPTEQQIRSVFEACPGWSADRIIGAFKENPNQGKPARFYGWFVAHGKLIYGAVEEQERMRAVEEERWRTAEQLRRHEERQRKAEEAEHAKLRESWAIEKRRLWELLMREHYPIAAGVIEESEVVECDDGLIHVRVPQEYRLAFDNKAVHAAISGYPKLKIEFIAQKVPA